MTTISCQWQTLKKMIQEKVLGPRHLGRFGGKFPCGASFYTDPAVARPKRRERCVNAAVRGTWEILKRTGYEIADL